jgi:hypothetical protein
MICMCSDQDGEPGELVSVSKVGEHGQFQFSRVPCGKYWFVPNFGEKYPSMELEPPRMPVEMRGHMTRIKEMMSFAGFWVDGRVMFKGSPAPKAIVAISVNDVVLAKLQTATDGTFRALIRYPGPMVATIEYDDIQYRPFPKNYWLKPESSSLGDINLLRKDEL